TRAARGAAYPGRAHRHDRRARDRGAEGLAAGERRRRGAGSEAEGADGAGREHRAQGLSLTYWQGPALDMLGDQFQQPVGAHRLGDIAHRAERLASVVALLNRGEEDDRNVRHGLVVLERGDELVAV